MTDSPWALPLDHEYENENKNPNNDDIGRLIVIFKNEDELRNLNSAVPVHYQIKDNDNFEVLFDDEIPEGYYRTVSGNSDCFTELATQRYIDLFKVAPLS